MAATIQPALFTHSTPTPTSRPIVKQPIYDSGNSYTEVKDYNPITYRGKQRPRKYKARAIDMLIKIPGHETTFGIAPSKGREIKVQYVRSNPLTDGMAEHAIAQIAPSIVKVNAWGNDKSRWSGSGTIVDLAEVFPGVPFPPNTYGILTNNHVAPAGETKFMTVTLPDGTSLEARVLVSPVSKSGVQDETVDAAMLIVQSKTPLPTAKIASEPPRIGETILTGGHPLGLPKMSFTRGIVSQPAQETGFAVDVIQMDAEINGGNSGGAAFNLKGEIIGTNTFTFRDTTGLSFAIPIKTQFKVLDTILKTGEFVRGNLGFEVKEFTDFERKFTGYPVPSGAKISWVDYGSQAYQKGLRSGDIVARIMDQKGKELNINIDNPFEVTRFLQWMHKLPPKSKALMVVYHAKKEGSKVTYTPETIELDVSKLTNQRTALKSETWGFFIEKDHAGHHIIRNIEPNSPASKAGIESGKWALIGIKAGQISDKPVMIQNLDSFKDILIMLRDSEAHQFDLYLVDSKDPKIKKKVTLKREIVDSYFAMIMKSARESVAGHLAA